MALAFAGQTFALLTQHGKQDIMAPLLAAEGIALRHTDAFDTDQLGRFDGTVERQQSAFATARRKAELACELTGCEIGLGSEGTFSLGPLGLGHAMYEIVVAVHARQQWYVQGSAWQSLTPQADLRAHKCPPRRPIIAAATADLLLRLGRTCPSCSAPDFSFDVPVAGQPCQACRWPTQQAKVWQAECRSCGETALQQVSKLTDPRFCERCNP